MEKFCDLEPHLPANPTEEDLVAGRRADEDAIRRENNNYFLGSNLKGYKK